MVAAAAAEEEAEGSRGEASTHAVVFAAPRPELRCSSHWRR